MEAQQRAEIISYARKTIVQMGVKALRMDDVAQATHTSKRTLYETFGDKEELLFLAVQAHFDAFNKKNFEAAKEADNILISMLIVMEEVRKNAEINWLIRSSLKRFYPKVNQRLWHDKADEKKKIIAESIKIGVKHGYIEPRINIALTMNMFSYIAIGISENNDMIEIPKEISTESAFHEVLVNYIRGISTIKGVQTIDDYLAKRANNNKK